VRIALALVALALLTAAPADARRSTWTLDQARAFTASRVPVGYDLIDCYGFKRGRPGVGHQRPGRYVRFTCVAWYDGPCARELRFRVRGGRAKVTYRSPYTCPGIIDSRL
jgi:hypothetical protein